MAGQSVAFGEAPRGEVDLLGEHVLLTDTGESEEIGLRAGRGMPGDVTHALVDLGRLPRDELGGDTWWGAGVIGRESGRAGEDGGREQDSVCVHAAIVAAPKRADEPAGEVASKKRVPPQPRIPWRRPCRLTTSFAALYEPARRQSGCRTADSKRGFCTAGRPRPAVVGAR